MKASSLSFSFLLILFLSSCANKALSPDEETAMHDEIKKVLFDQQDHWNNGSIDDFMKGYWHSDKLSFVGKSGVNRGWNTTLNNYKKNYPDRDAMGKLSFDILELRTLSRNSCYMIGKYTLERKSDRPSGHFTLILVDNIRSYLRLKKNFVRKIHSNIRNV